MARGSLCPALAVEYETARGPLCPALAVACAVPIQLGTMDGEWKVEACGVHGWSGRCSLASCVLAHALFMLYCTVSPLALRKAVRIPAC